jgi:hypothetical protein
MMATCWGRIATQSFLERIVRFQAFLGPVLYCYATQLYTIENTGIPVSLLTECSQTMRYLHLAQCTGRDHFRNFRH